MMKRLSKALLLSLVALLLISMPVLATVAYRASYTIVESAGTPYDMLPTSVLVDNQWLADNGFMQDDALDTRIETLGGSPKPHMVASNKTLTSTAVPANSQTNLYYTTTNADLVPPSMDIITGYDGYITITDDDTPAQETLELGSDFEIEQSGYVDTDAGADKNLVYKEDAFRTYIDGAETITSEITEALTFTDYDPTADGTINENTIAGGLPTAWQTVIDSNDATYMINPTGVDLTDLFISPGIFDDRDVLDKILSIEVWWRAERVVVGCTGRAELYINGSEYFGDVETYTGAWVWYDYEWVTNPDTVLAWTVADLENLEFGFNQVETTGDDAKTSECYLKVNYSPSNEVTATGIDSGEHIVQTSEAPGLEFDGNDDYIDCGTSTNLQMALSDFSIEQWIYPTEVLFNDVAGTKRTSFVNVGAGYQAGWYYADPGYYFYLVLGTVGTKLRANSGNIAAGYVNKWTHLVWTVDRDVGVKLYLDGVDTAITDTIGANYNGVDISATDFYVGKSSYLFKGTMGEVRVYSRVLSPAEVLEHSNGVFTDESDLEGFWKLDEGEGVVAVDSSGEGNTGTINGATWDAANPLIRLDIDDGDIRIFGKGGAAVSPNTNDWILNQNNVMPYMDYYKHTVSGVLHAWYQPNYMVTATDYDGTASGGSTTTIIDDGLTQTDDYWNNALVTITGAGAAAPEGETSVVTDFDDASNTLTVAPAFTIAVENTDKYTVDFGTLIDRSYYGLEFDALGGVVSCVAAADMDITDKATLTAWVYIDTDGENDEGSIIDRRDATDGYRIYVSSDTGSNVAIEAILDCVTTDAYAKSAIEISTGAWHYIVAVYDRLGTNHWEIYEDGILLTLGTDTAGVGAIIGHTANVMNIGDNAASNRNFDGKIDEPSFYTRAFAQAEVISNYNSGSGLYTPFSSINIALQLHMEEGVGNTVADTSGEANTGTRAGTAAWVNGKVPRPAGNGGTNDSRVTWGVNPTGVGVTLGGMVSEGQPTPGALPDDPARDILPETEVSDWFIEPAVGVGESLRANPLRPFVTMMSGDDSPTDRNTLTEIQAWRILALAVILMVTVSTAMGVGHHQGITMIVAGVAILGAVVLTIFPMWSLVFAIGMFIGGLVMERSPSL